MDSRKNKLIQVEIGLDKIEALFNQGDLCAADIRCLNCESSKCIWNLCLKSCAKKMQCNAAQLERYSFCDQSAQKLKLNSALHVYVEQEYLAHIA